MRKLFGKGALVDAVSPDGIAARYDIQPGDVILAIDGDEPTDLIDYQLLTAYDAFTLTVRRGDEQFDIEIDNEEYQPLGIRFPSAAFDGVHVCEITAPSASSSRASPACGRRCTSRTTTTGSRSSTATSSP